MEMQQLFRQKQQTDAYLISLKHMRGAINFCNDNTLINECNDHAMPLCFLF